MDEIVEKINKYEQKHTEYLDKIEKEWKQKTAK